MEMEHSVTARVFVFRSRYSSKADDTVEEVEFWEGVPKGPSRLLLPGTTVETAAKFSSQVSYLLEPLTR
jgi:hypothetical protein